MAKNATDTQAEPTRRKAQGGRPTRQAAAELERRILEVAAELFATQGYAATTMEQVAEVCQSGKDTIYRRYASKGLLFAALMEKFRAEITLELDACLAEPGTALVRLQRYARALLSVNLRPQLVALNRVALGEAVPAKGVQPAPGSEDPFMRRMAELVRAAQDEAVLAPNDADFVAEQLLYATSIKPLVATMLGETRFAEAQEQQAYFERAWALFMTGAATGSETRTK